MSSALRDYAFGRDLDGFACTTLGSHLRRAFYLPVEFQVVTKRGNPNGRIAIQAQLVLAAAAHVIDMAEVLDRPQIVMPQDVARLAGMSPKRAADELAALGRLGLLKGSSRAGYQLSGPMAEVSYRP